MAINLRKYNLDNNNELFLLHFIQTSNCANKDLLFRICCSQNHVCIGCDGFKIHSMIVLDLVYIVNIYLSYGCYKNVIRYRCGSFHLILWNSSNSKKQSFRTYATLDWILISKINYFNVIYVMIMTDFGQHIIITSSVSLVWRMQY